MYDYNIYYIYIQSEEKINKSCNENAKLGF